MKKLLFIAAAILAVALTSRADTSYLLVQGDFGAAGAEQTYLWKVLYQPGSLSTSQDLLNSVFGKPVDTRTTFTDAFSGTYELYSAGNTQKGVNYINFGTAGAPSLFVISYSFNGVSLTMDPTYSPGWTSYVAGGTGQSAVGTYPNQSFGNYPAGTWSFSQESLNSRGVTNGSFDGWVYGSTSSTTSISNGTTTDAPVAANFASATVITVVPEPASAALLMMGGIGLVRRRRR